MEAVQPITISGTDVSFASSCKGNSSLEVLEENQIVNSFTNKLSQVDLQEAVQPVLSAGKDSFSSSNDEIKCFFIFVSRIFFGLKNFYR